MTPCFNEEAVIRDCVEEVSRVMKTELPKVKFTHLVIDNGSTDGTLNVLRNLVPEHNQLKVIVNSRNFGPHKSPFYAKLQMDGDAVIPFVADLQMPAYKIPELVGLWEEGFDSVLGIRISESEGIQLRIARKIFYKIMKVLTGKTHISNFIGFGIFGRNVISEMGQFNDPEPYFRGLLQEVGFSTTQITYNQPPRAKGKSKQGFWDYLEYAALGLTKSTSRPLYIVFVLGTCLAAAATFVGVTSLILKVIFWNSFAQGTASILILISIFSAINLFSLGIFGLYINVILQQVRGRPLVIEKERINF